MMRTMNGFALEDVAGTNQSEVLQKDMCSSLCFGLLSRYLEH